MVPPSIAAGVDFGAVRIVGAFHNPFAAAFGITVVRGGRIFWRHAPAHATSLLDCAHLAHELVHVWQYQHLKRNGLQLLADRTYRYRLSPGARFADFGAEQQASIVEDYVRLKGGAGPRRALRPVPPIEEYERAIATSADCGRALICGSR